MINPRHRHHHPARWVDAGAGWTDRMPRLSAPVQTSGGSGADFCFVRQNVGGRMVLTTYGRSSGFCVDPIEKKAVEPFLSGHQRALLRHGGLQPRLPLLSETGTSARRASSTTSRIRPRRKPSRPPAQKLGCWSVAFTYNDPVVFAEYAMDVADACREAGIAAVAVTAGYNDR